MTPGPCAIGLSLAKRHVRGKKKALQGVSATEEVFWGVWLDVTPWLIQDGKVRLTAHTQTSVYMAIFFIRSPEEGETGTRNNDCAEEKKAKVWNSGLRNAQPQALN